MGDPLFAGEGVSPLPSLGVNVTGSWILTMQADSLSIVLGHYKKAGFSVWVVLDCQLKYLCSFPFSKLMI